MCEIALSVDKKYAGTGGAQSVFCPNKASMAKKEPPVNQPEALLFQRFREVIIP
jgi:hypothetical protein